MKTRRLFQLTEETVLYVLAVVFLFLAFALTLSLVGIIVAPLFAVGAVALFLFARHIEQGRNSLTPRS